MRYPDRLNNLQNRIYARRTLFDRLKQPVIKFGDVLKGLYATQLNYLGFVLANYLIVALELIVIQYLFAVYTDAESLGILRLISFFSLLPLFVFLATDRNNRIDYKGLKIDGINLNLTAARFLFIFKSVLSLLIISVLIRSNIQINSLPSLIWAVLLARLLSTPLESVIGFLFLRNTNAVYGNILITRSFSVLLDLSAILLLAFKLPLLYFVVHISLRLYRANYLIRQQLNIKLLSFLICSRSDLDNLKVFFKFVAKSVGLPFLIIVFSELIFYQFTRPIVALSPLYAQMIFLVHTHYHCTLFVTLRFLRIQLNEFRETGRLLDFKSRAQRFASWRKSCLLTILLSAPVVLIAGVPFVLKSALDIAGATESFPRYIFVWPFFVGFSHCLFAVLAAVLIKGEFKIQLAGFVLMFLPFFLSHKIISYITNFNFSKDNLFSLLLLSDALLHMFSVLAASLLILRFVRKTKDALPEISEALGNGLYKILNISWRKGVTNRALIISKALNFKEYKYLKYSNNKYALIFSANQPIQLNELLKKLCFFVDRIDFRQHQGKVKD